MNARALVNRVGDLLGMGVSHTRELTGPSLWAVRLLGFLFSAFFVYGAVNGSITAIGPRAWSPFTIEFPFVPYYSERYALPLFIFFTSVLVFLLYPAGTRSSRRRPSKLDLLFCLLALAVLCEFIYFYDERGDRAGIIEWNDVVFGLIAAVLVWETCRRVLGLVLPLVAVVFLFYDWAGPIFPGLLSHKGAEFGYVMGYLYSQAGIYGIITRVYAEVVFVFIVFGALLQATRVGDVFVDLAFALVGRYKGGSAKASVVSSGMVGSVVGSGAANIVITGTFTIPLMKRSGYRPAYAAAVEAVASIGGHLMPPVMGSAAFLLAAITETPYWRVALLSLVPALLYYLSLFMAVHFRASSRNLRGLPREELPDFWTVLRRDGLLLLPVLLLIVLLIAQFSPFFAAFWSMAASIVCYTIKRRCWTLLALEASVFVASFMLGGFPMFLYLAVALIIASRQEEARRILGLVANAFVKGATNSLVIGATAGVMGLVLTGVTHPDLAQKMTALILSYSGGYLFLAIVLVALASYLLGMGMTITASYILIAILAGPALQDLGLSMFTAHMIILWLSQDAALTPPFALGAFVAAGVAQCDPMRTGFISLKLAKPLYVVPVLMAYTPILMNGPWSDVITAWVGAAFGFVCTSAIFEGYMLRRLNLLDYVILSVAAVGFFWHGVWFNVVGFALLGLSLLMQRARPREFSAMALPLESAPADLSES